MAAAGNLPQPRPFFCHARGRRRVPRSGEPRGGDGGNRALYFIVGGLVVLAAVFVFIFTNNDVGDGAQDAGTNAPAPTATEPAAPAPAPVPEGDTGGTTTNQ